MTVLLYGKNAQSIRALVTEHGFTVNTDNPDTVISYGGDGTLLAAERAYPNVPKLALRDSSVCQKCAEHADDIVLAELKYGQLPLVSYQKLAVQFNNRKLVALSDVVIRNSVPMHAIRFNVFLENILLNQEPVIGDGLVIATAFGSSGYFHSITRQAFAAGIGIAFNNSTKVTAPIFPVNSDEIVIKIVRGPGTLSVDNNPTITHIDSGDKILVKIADQEAKIYDANALRCPKCIVARDKILSS